MEEEKGEVGNINCGLGVETRRWHDLTRGENIQAVYRGGVVEDVGHLWS